MDRQEQMERACEREEAAASEDYLAGRINTKQYNERIRDIQREYRAAAEEAAQDAYESERERW